MNELETREQAIREYVNLQRIKAAADMKKEVEYQEKVLKSRLVAMGVPTEELDMK